MNKIITTITTSTDAVDLEKVVKFYAYESSYDFYNVLKNHSAEIADKNKDVRMLITDAVDVSEFFNNDGNIETPFDKDAIAINEFQKSEGLLVEAQSYGEIKRYVIDAEYVFRDCDVVFESANYHKQASVPKGLSRIVKVEEQAVRNGVEGDVYVDCAKYNSWEDILQVFSRFANLICGGTFESYTRVEISLPIAAEVDEDADQDLADEIAVTRFGDKWGGELVSIDGKNYVISSSANERIFSTDWWECRFC